MVATAIPDIEGNLRAAMLGSALGRKFEHDPQRLADHIGVRVRRVPSTEITHWKGAHVHSSAYYCHHDGEIVISETAQGGWLTWAFSHELGHALALQDWHTSIDEGEHSCDIFARAFLSDIDDSFRQVPGARFRLQFAVTWAEARISEWKAALPGAAPFRLLNLEDSVSVAQYGLRDRVLVVKDILPLGLSVTALAQASATLYSVAVTYLQRHKDPQVAYEVECVGLRHMRPDGRPYFRVGDKLTLDYVGTYTDEGGTLREDLRVRQDLYVMAATRSYGPAGESTWKLTISTVARSLPNDSDLIVSMLSEIGVAKISPLPFLTFGDANGTTIMRIDDTGMLVRGASSATDQSTAIYWLPNLTFSGDVGDQLPRAQLQSSAGTYSGKPQSLPAFRGYGAADRYVGINSTVANTGGADIDELAQIMESNYGNSRSALTLTSRVSDGVSRADLDADVSRVSGWFALGDLASSTQTIASGVITPDGSYQFVDTEGAAATDNLDTIDVPASHPLSGRPGAVLILRAANDARTVVCKDGTGNLKLAGDCTLDNVQDTLTLLWTGAVQGWIELARSNNGA